MKYVYLINAQSFSDNVNFLVLKFAFTFMTFVTEVLIKITLFLAYTTFRMIEKKDDNQKENCW